MAVPANKDITKSIDQQAALMTALDFLSPFLKSDEHKRNIVKRDFESSYEEASQALSILLNFHSKLQVINYLRTQERIDGVSFDNVLPSFSDSLSNAKETLSTLIERESQNKRSISP